MNRYAERVEDWFHNGSPKPKQYPVEGVIQGVPLIRWVIVAFSVFSEVVAIRGIFLCIFPHRPAGEGRSEVNL